MKNHTQKQQFPQHKSRQSYRGEEGMAMVAALLMGVVLLAGTTGLMIRQLAARKLGAAESYQQMAESAALNGLNRILSDLNRDDSNHYRFFAISQQ
jgi:Tfp pilus assembly protein PilV